MVGSDIPFGQEIGGSPSKRASSPQRKKKFATTTPVPPSYTIREVVTSGATATPMAFNITTGEVSNGEFENVSSVAITNGHEAYERRFTGLEGIGKSGMTFLEELIDGALRASRRPHRYEQEIWGCLLDGERKNVRGLQRRV